LGDDDEVTLFFTTTNEDLEGAAFIAKVRRKAFGITKEPGASTYEEDDGEDEEDVEDGFEEDEHAAACALEELQWTAADERDARESRPSSSAQTAKGRGEVRKRTRASRITTTSPQSSPDSINAKRLRQRQTWSPSPASGARGDASTEVRSIRRRSRRLEERASEDRACVVVADLLASFDTADA